MDIHLALSLSLSLSLPFLLIPPPTQPFYLDIVYTCIDDFFNFLSTPRDNTHMLFFRDSESQHKPPPYHNPSVEFCHSVFLSTCVNNDIGTHIINTAYIQYIYMYGISTMSCVCVCVNLVYTASLVNKDLRIKDTPLIRTLPVAPAIYVCREVYKTTSEIRRPL